MTTPTFVLLGVIVSLVAFACGVLCIVRFARNRRAGLLVGGLLLMLVVPGLILIVALGHFNPWSFGTYGPPPTTMP